jgi:acyl-CoA thioesterase FadM
LSIFLAGSEFVSSSVSVALGAGYFIASEGTIGYTAYLNVQYRQLLPAGSDAVIRVEVEKIERRKVFLKARIESEDGKKVFSTATALYIMAAHGRKISYHARKKKSENK